MIKMWRLLRSKNGTDLNQHIDALIKSPATIRQIRFATDSRPASGNVQKADFPRLDIMLDGQLHDAGIKADPPVLSRHDVLFIHAGGWHSPRWQSPCTVLSIVFDKQQLELTLTRWNGSMLNVEERLQVPRRGPRTGSFCSRRSMRCRCNRRNNTPRDTSLSAC